MDCYKLDCGKLYLLMGYKWLNYSCVLEGYMHCVVDEYWIKYFKNRFYKTMSFKF